MTIDEITNRALQGIGAVPRHTEPTRVAIRGALRDLLMTLREVDDRDLQVHAWLREMEK